MRNFVYYNFCWRLSFQPLEENWATSGLFNILNGINIGNLWPIYAAIRAYFKNSILKSFAFYNFCWILDFQPLEDWATSGLLNILNGINIANPLPMAYLKIKFCEISHLQLLLETWFSALRRGLVCPKLIIDQLMGLLNILNGINIMNPWLMYAVTRVYLKYCTWRNFPFYRFSKYLGSQPLQKGRATLEPLEVTHETVTLKKALRKNVINVIFKKCIFLNFTFNSC